jgi:hypothetical protein
MNILLPVSPCWPVQAVQTKLLAIPSPPNLFSWVHPSHRLYIYCFLYVLSASNLFSDFMPIGLSWLYNYRNGAGKTLGALVEIMHNLEF